MKQLSPEEQREIRARYGSDVQTLDQAMNMAAEFVSKATGFEIKVQPEDRLRAHIIEALTWLNQGAPGRAAETLERALKIKSDYSEVLSDRDRYKDALVKLWRGDFVGTPINQDSGAFRLIDDVLAWSPEQISEALKEGTR